MANVVVVGAQWGDEGKGKIVDWLSEQADIVVRFQGGHNAGHQQNQREGFQQPAQYRAHRALDARRRVTVGPEARETVGGLGGGQPGEPAAEPAGEFVGRQAPKGLVSRLGRVGHGIPANGGGLHNDRNWFAWR